MQIIEDAAMHDQYCRVITPEPAINEETEEVCALLKQCYALRYNGAHTNLVCSCQPHNLRFSTNDSNSKDSQLLVTFPSHSDNVGGHATKT